MVIWFIPNPAITRFHSDTQANTSKLKEVLRNKDLLRMDFGVFTLHAILMSVFMQVPFILRANGLDIQHQWQVYLPVMLIAFVLMVPPIIIAEKKAKLKQVLAPLDQPFGEFSAAYPSAPKPVPCSCVPPRHP